MLNLYFDFIFFPKLGNKKYIPSLKFSSKEIETNNAESKDDSTNHAMISYQGALVDVGKLMEQLERSEKARLDADEKVKALQLQLGEHCNFRN